MTVHVYRECAWKGGSGRLEDGPVTVARVVEVVADGGSHEDS